MNRDGINRRGACKTLLTLGGLAVSGLAHAQAPTAATARHEPAPVVRTPEEALQMLKDGNARFFSGKATRPELSAVERRAQILGQSPFAVVLGCSDSRVPTEIIFDQNLGSLFITRVAGNIVETATTGSIEYAVEHLNTRLVVVMGHEGCGAVKAALLSDDDRSHETPAIQSMLDRILPAVRNLPPIRDEKARMREAVVANVRQQVADLKQERSIKSWLAAGKIAIVGAFYEISSGAVDFLETEAELRLTSATSGWKWRAHLAG